MSKSVYLFSTSKVNLPNIIDIKSLDVTLLQPKIDFSKYDYFIISSKQVSKALKNYNIDDYKNKKALCVSSVSARYYKDIGGEVLDIADGYGDGLVQIIKKYPKELQWLYLRGENIASNFAEVCRRDGYKIDESILYRTQCSKEILEVKTQESATLIFTSPSNVHCFLKATQFKSAQKVIVIGKTTAKALPASVDYKMARVTTIEACLELIEF
ncbi:MAG: uroporphyrinogen-III synthase [Campylobacterota bacterium]|nr:uroporphyrinogen-III synthase [Campylobacterota bacterium]